MSLFQTGDFFGLSRGSTALRRSSRVRELFVDFFKNRSEDILQVSQGQKRLRGFLSQIKRFSLGRLVT